MMKPVRTALCSSFMIFKCLVILYTSMHLPIHPQIIEQFLNNSFTTLDDLNNIDSIVTAIESSRSLLKSSIPNDSQPQNNHYLDDFRSHLNSTIENDDIQQLQKLISNYGDLEILTNLNNELSNKISLIQLNSLFNQYKSINNNIQNLTKLEPNLTTYIDEIKSVSTLILDLNSTDVTKNKDTLNKLVSNLNRKLSTVINNDDFKNLLLSKLADTSNWEDTETKISDTTVQYLHQLIELQLLDPFFDKDHDTWWSFDRLIENFKIKFIYHFTGNNETNKLNKPEYPLDYLKNYLVLNLPVLKLKFKLNNASQKYFVYSILKPVKSKFKNDLKQINSSKLLSHLILEFQNFDKFLVNKFKFVHFDNLLTNELILTDDPIFNRWLNNEKDFVNHRYNELIDSTNAFEIDYEFVETNKTKPTKSSINLKNLLNGIISNYEFLPTKYKIKFLSEIQLKLLNFYYSKLKSGLDSLSSTNNDNLERICKIWCSSKYMIEAMIHWDESCLFVELNDSINNNEGKTFFQSVINGYQKDLIDEVSKKFKQFFERNLNKQMKPYFQNNSNWSHLSEDEIQLSNDLNLVISSLSKDLKYLKNTVNNLDYSNIKHIFLNEIISSYFQRNFIYLNRFNSNGALKLKNDYLNVHSSLDLLKDNINYGKLIEIFKLLETTDGRVVDTRGFKLLKESEINDLIQRRIR